MKNSHSRSPSFHRIIASLLTALVCQLVAAASASASFFSPSHIPSSLPLPILILFSSFIFYPFSKASVSTALLFVLFSTHGIVNAQVTSHYTTLDTNKVRDNEYLSSLKSFVSATPSPSSASISSSLSQHFSSSKSTSIQQDDSSKSSGNPQMCAPASSSSDKQNTINFREDSCPSLHSQSSSSSSSFSSSESSSTMGVPNRGDPDEHNLNYLSSAYGRTDNRFRNSKQQCEGMSNTDVKKVWLVDVIKQAAMYLKHTVTGAADQTQAQAQAQAQAQTQAQAMAQHAQAWYRFNQDFKLKISTNDIDQKKVGAMLAQSMAVQQTNNNNNKKNKDFTTLTIPTEKATANNAKYSPSTSTASATTSDSDFSHIKALIVASSDINTQPQRLTPLMAIAETMANQFHVQVVLMVPQGTQQALGDAPLVGDIRIIEFPHTAQQSASVTSNREWLDLNTYNEDSNQLQSSQCSSSNSTSYSSSSSTHSGSSLFSRIIHFVKSNLAPSLLPFTSGLFAHAFHLANQLDNDLYNSYDAARAINELVQSGFTPSFILTNLHSWAVVDAVELVQLHTSNCSQLKATKNTPLCSDTYPVTSHHNINYPHQYLNHPLLVQIDTGPLLGEPFFSDDTASAAILVNNLSSTSAVYNQKSKWLDLARWNKWAIDLHCLLLHKVLLYFTLRRRNTVRKTKGLSPLTTHFQGWGIHSRIFSEVLFGVEIPRKVPPRFTAVGPIDRDFNVSQVNLPATTIGFAWRARGDNRPILHFNFLPPLNDYHKIYHKTLETNTTHNTNRTRIHPYHDHDHDNDHDHLITATINGKKKSELFQHSSQHFYNDMYEKLVDVIRSPQFASQFPDPKPMIFLSILPCENISHPAHFCTKSNVFYNVKALKNVSESVLILSKVQVHPIRYRDYFETVAKVIGDVGVFVSICEDHGLGVVSSIRTGQRILCLPPHSPQYKLKQRMDYTQASVSLSADQLTTPNLAALLVRQLQRNGSSSKTTNGHGGPGEQSSSQSQSQTQAPSSSPGTSHLIPAPNPLAARLVSREILNMIETERNPSLTTHHPILVNEIGERIFRTPFDKIKLLERRAFIADDRHIENSYLFFASGIVLGVSVYIVSTSVDLSLIVKLWNRVSNGKSISLWKIK